MTASDMRKGLMFAARTYWDTHTDAQLLNHVETERRITGERKGGDRGGRGGGGGGGGRGGGRGGEEEGGGGGRGGGRGGRGGGGRGGGGRGRGEGGRREGGRLCPQRGCDRPALGRGRRRTRCTTHDQTRHRRHAGADGSAAPAHRSSTQGALGGTVRGGKRRLHLTLLRPAGRARGRARSAPRGSARSASATDRLSRSAMSRARRRSGARGARRDLARFGLRVGEARSAYASEKVTHMPPWLSVPGRCAAMPDDEPHRQPRWPRRRASRRRTAALEPERVVQLEEPAAAWSQTSARRGRPTRRARLRTARG